MRRDATVWTPLVVGDEVCLDEPVSTGEYSRVDILLPGGTTKKLGPEGGFVARVSEDEEGLLLEIWRGIGRAIRRQSSPVQISTPMANAGLRGTEVDYRFDGESLVLSVAEGAVDIDGAAGELSLERGQRVAVSAAAFSELAPFDAAGPDIYWALYYPRILDGPLPAPDAGPPAGGDVAGFHLARAEARLRSGSFDAASEDIALALTLVPGDPRAFALDAMMALSQGRLYAARRQLEMALAVAPDHPTVRIVESYLLAHDGAIRAALDAARRAVRLAPDSAIAWSRLAVASLAADADDEAVAAARSALAIDGSDGLSLAVLGFVALDAGDIAAAGVSFDAAIAADPGAPFPRIGRALMQFRQREAVAGRQSVEIAVALDPNNSIIRSYMSKAYLDELRFELAETQLELAADFNGDDPTVALYSALARQSQNQSVAALRDLTTATSLNGNRTPFRPSWGVDDDQVSAVTSLAPIYRSNGYEGAAMLAGSHAVLVAPWDYAGHQLVADVASILPRYQIMRVSEVKQARVLQPLNVRPVAPHVAQVNLLLMDSVGPAEIAQAESRPGFTRDGISVQTSGVIASQDTHGENFIIAGLSGNSSWNLGQSYYETGGFRANNDLEHRVGTALYQRRLSSDTSVLAEWRSARTVKGDIALLFDPLNFDALLRQYEDIDSLEFGLTHRITPFSTLVGSVRLDEIDLAANSGSAFATSADGNGGSAELQIQNALPKMNLISGVRAVHWDLDEVTSFLAPIPVPPFLTQLETVSDSRDRLINAYIYAHRELSEHLYLTVGLSFDWLDVGLVKEQQTNPKLGLSWRPAADTYLRFAAFQSVQGPVVSKQLTQGFLEPTQVAGFGQYLFGTAGEIARNYALGFDHGLTSSLRIGFDRTERSLDIPFVDYSQPTPQPALRRLSARESTDGVHLYWTPIDRLALRAGWENEDFDYRGELSPYSFSSLRTERIPLAATAFFGRAFSLRVTGTYARQQGNFDAPGPAPGPGPNLVPGHSRLWVVDTAVDYRLPRRLGTLEFGIRNLFDDNSRFQDTDPENPRIFPERMALLRFSLDF